MFCYVREISESLLIGYEDLLTQYVYILPAFAVACWGLKYDSESCSRNYISWDVSSWIFGRYDPLQTGVIKFMNISELDVYLSGATGSQHELSLEMSSINIIVSFYCLLLFVVSSGPSYVGFYYLFYFNTVNLVWSDFPSFMSSVSGIFLTVDVERKGDES